MAGSCKPEQLNLLSGNDQLPARTPGPLGINDQGDPFFLTQPGDTPGPLGINDHADPNLFADKAAGTKQVADTALNWDEVNADFARWEGKVSHMYLDTKGLVTVGIGKMLPNVAAAQALAFVRRSDNAAATAAEIETDFKEVSKQAKGKLASAYKQYTKLDLPDKNINDLLKSVVEGFESDLEKNFTGYKTYPVAVKRALLDMIYNLGLAGLLKFKKLKASIEAGEWKKASEECHRAGPSEERNNWTRDLFLEAGK